MHFLHVIVMFMNYILLMQDHYIPLCCINFSLYHFLPALGLHLFSSLSLSISLVLSLLHCWLDYQLVHTEQIHLFMQDHPALKWLGHFFLVYFFFLPLIQHWILLVYCFWFFFFRFAFFLCALCLLSLNFSTLNKVKPHGLNIAMSVYALIRAKFYGSNFTLLHFKGIHVIQVATSSASNWVKRKRPPHDNRKYDSIFHVYRLHATTFLFVFIHLHFSMK